MNTDFGMIDILRSAQQEARNLAAMEPNAFVFCMSDDLAPFRYNGKEIRLHGGDVYFALSPLDVEPVLRGLNRTIKPGADYCVRALPAFKWAPRRVEVLDKLINSLPLEAF